MKKKPIACDFFDLLQDVYVSSSEPHAKLCATKQKLIRISGVLELKRITDTHWKCQYSVTTAIKRTYLAILKHLKSCQLHINAESMSRSPFVPTQGDNPNEALKPVVEQILSAFAVSPTQR